MLPSEAPVLVVGAGPSGTMASLLLEQLGITTVLIERRTGPQRAPAAHVVNARTFEICRAAGVDAKALAEAAKSPADAGYVYWVTQLGGRVLGRLPFEGQADEQLALTPTPLRNLSQNRFEPILFDSLRRVAGRTPCWQHQWESSAPTRDGVCSRVRNLATGREHEITSRWVIAADGAGSRVRKSLGIEMQGPERLQSFLMIHFQARLRGLPEIPPGVLFFVCDPAAGGGVFIVHDLDGQATFMRPFDPDREPMESYTPERCEGFVRDALADPTLELRIETIDSWTMTAQVAQRFRDGRVFLIGDSAHRFPPTGGLGLNTGVQDAHNLAWKLAAVAKGWAGTSLLDSFESERRPVAQTNADQSLRNALRLIQVAQALGVSDMSDASRARFAATLADPAGCERVREAIARQAEHFDMPGLQLGFSYGEGALLRADDEAPPGSLDVRTFTPSGRPGARLPHTWITKNGARASLLDQVPLDRFLLLAGPDGDAWIDALASTSGVPIEGRKLTPNSMPDLDAWLAVAGIDRSGALLVRPDQHVAWRARCRAAQPARELSRALDVILARRV